MSEINVDITPPSVGNITISRSDSPVLSVSGKVGIVTLNKNDVGLENVKNTSDYLPLSGGTVTGKVTINNSVEEGLSTLAINDYSHAEGWRSVAGDKASYIDYYSNTRVFVLDPSTSYKLNNITNGTKLYFSIEDVFEDFPSIIVENIDTVNGYLTAVSDVIGTDGIAGAFFVNSTSFSHAEGSATTASGTASHAEGENTTASGTASHAEGSATTASGTASHAEGSYTSASGPSSHAENFLTIAQGEYSHAEGFSTESVGDASHAENYITKAQGNYSHAEGIRTTATGIGSHSEGNSTLARGNYSHAAGSYSEAAHDRTWVWSSSTITKRVSTTRSGQFMVSADGGVFFPGKIGIGTNVLDNNILNVNGDVSIVSNISGSGELSIDNTLIGQCDGGLYIGNTKVINNFWSLKETNLATSWVLELSGIYFSAIKTSSDGKFLLGANKNGYIYISNDYGNTWSPKASSLAWRNVQISPDGKYQFASTNDKFYRSINYGNSWSEVGSFRMDESAISSNGKTIIISTGSSLRISRDYGLNWTVISSGTSFLYQIAMSSNGKIIFVAMGFPNRLMASYDGSSFNFLYDVPFYAGGVGMSSNGKIITCINQSDGEIYVSYDYGKTFELKKAGMYGNTKIKMSSDGRVQIAYGGISNYIEISLDYGNTWTTTSHQIGNGMFTDLSISADGKILTGTFNFYSNIVVGISNPYLYVCYNDILTQGGISTQTVSLSNVQFTGETKTTTNPVTATDLYLKVNVNNQTKYIRLFDVS